MPSVLLCADRHAERRLGATVGRLAVGLVDQAVEVRLLATADSFHAAAVGAMEVVRLEQPPWPFSRMALRRVLDVLGDRPATVVHALGASAAAWAHSIASAWDVELVVDLNSEEECRVAAGMGFRVDAWVAASTFLRDLAVQHFRFPADTTEVIPPGVPAGAQVACFAEERRAPTLLCTSPLVGGGVDRLLEAMSTLHRRGVAPLLFLWGEGPQEDALRRLARRLGLHGQVTFAHPIGDTSDAMSGADAFIRTQTERAVFVDALQAMGQGLAVVCPEDGGCDSVRPGETVFVYDPEIPDHLAEVLHDMLTRRAAARETARRALEYVRARHTVSGMAEQTAKLYHRLMSRHATIRLKE